MFIFLYFQGEDSVQIFGTLSPNRVHGALLASHIIITPFSSVSIVSIKLTPCVNCVTSWFSWVFVILQNKLNDNESLEPHHGGSHSEDSQQVAGTVQYEECPTVSGSVEDQDPDPPVFGPPGSGSFSQRYGSGSFPFLIKVLNRLK